MNNEQKNKREVIPFDTKRIVDTDLKEGEELVLTHGRDGLRVWDDDGELIDESEPINRLVAYGPTSRVVPAGENRVMNTDLNDGVENVISEGFTGLQMVDDNGKVIEEYPPVPAEIEYGPRRERISYDIIRKPNNDLEDGEVKVVAAGKPGRQLVDEQGNVTVIEETETEELEYGPKRVPISFDVQRRANNDLDEGETKVVTVGVEGQELEDEEGNITPVSDPVTEVIEYGPARVAIPYETVRKSNPDLDEGEEKVIAPGEKGLQLEDEEGNVTPVSDPVTEEIEYGPVRHYTPFETKRTVNSDLDEAEEKVIVAGKEGVQLEDEEGQMTLESDPVTAEIEYGPIRHAVPFETKRTVNADLDEGEEKVVVSGQEGIQLEDEEGTVTTDSNPVTEEIEYGPIRHYIPFETKRTANADLEEAEENVVAAGQEGVQLEDEEGTITVASDPVTEEIEYGPIRHSIPFETKRTANADLAEGQEQVIVGGQEGIELEDEEGNISRESDPVTEEIEYGPIRHFLPFETERRVNVDLAQGEERTAAAGEEGSELEDESASTSLLSNPVTEVIEYGPNRIPLPFDTVRQVNTELTEGEEKVVVEGQEGVRLEDEAGETIETHDPVTEEIEYGPEFVVLPYETKHYPYLELEEGDVVPLAEGVDGLKLVDEEGNTVESFNPIPEEIAYGPDEAERKELEDQK